MKISASIYSNKIQELEELIPELEKHHVDFFHIDCNDDISVFEDIRRIREISDTPIDLHVISPEPGKFFELIEEHQIEMTSFQYENLTEKLIVPESINTKVGMAIVSDTPVTIFEEYVDELSFILFMATTPGESGGDSNKNNFKKIREFRGLFPSIKIHVDGGVNNEVSFILRNMGVFAAVTGSYLMNSHSIGAAMLNLKIDNSESKFSIGDFMLGKDEIPVLNTESLNFVDVLQSIEDYKLGFTILTNGDGRLKGIISNADVRKGLLKNKSDFNNLPLDDMINVNPVCVNETQTVKDLLDIIKSKNFPILFVPVLNDNKEPVGVVKFNNLIKGES